MSMSKITPELLAYVEQTAHERNTDVASIEICASVFDTDGNWVDDFYLATKHYDQALLIDGEPEDA